MGRIKRIWYPGAIYHIVCRGNHQADIFLDEEDFKAYISILKQVRSNHGFSLYSYCLMTNHVHLQMETDQTNVGIIMRSISLFYTKYYNNKYACTGHLFQGRYRSELIEDDTYKLQVSKYIHLNPVKANIVRHISEYPWSSYYIFMGKGHSPLVNERKILQHFPEDGRTWYEKFVEYQVPPEFCR